MIPVIALVGRPNVGKSTLFNRLTHTRDALVANYSGLTRDRKYGEAEMEGRKYIVIDTGGISGGEEGIDELMAEQSLQAIDEADIVLFMLDARAGLTPADSMIAKHLRVQGKKTFLVANKIDAQKSMIASMMDMAPARINQIVDAIGEPYFESEYMHFMLPSCE